MSDKQKLKEQILEQRFRNPKLVCTLCKGLHEYAEEKNEIETVMWADFYEADSYITLGELDKAIEKLASLLMKQEQYQMDDFKDRTLNDLAICFDLKGDHILSLDYYLRGLKVATQHKNIEIQSAIYNNIGSIFLRYGDDKNALKYFEKGYKAIENAKEVNGKIKILYHIRKAQVYAHEKNIAGLQSEYEKAYDLYVKEGKNILQNVMFYLKMAIADFYEDAKLMHEYALEINKMCKESIVIEDWDDYIAILKILMKYDDQAETENLFALLKNLSEKEYMLERKRKLFLLWIAYLEKTEQYEEKQEYLRAYFLLEQETKKDKDNIKSQQIYNRLLLNQKIEEKSIMQKKKKDLHENGRKNALTLLNNRYVMIQYIEDIMDTCRLQKKKIRGALFEIQDFKELNNENGYVVGDLCLKYLGEAIHKNRNSKMMVAHMRGNEFMIVDYETNMEAVKEFIRGIESYIKYPFFINEIKIQIKINYGFFEMDLDNSTTILDVFHKANEALYGK